MISSSHYSSPYLDWGITGGGLVGIAHPVWPGVLGQGHQVVGALPGGGVTGNSGPGTSGPGSSVIGTSGPGTSVTHTSLKGWVAST